MSEETVVYTKKLKLPIVWEDPVDMEPGKFKVPWAEIVEVLKENPNKWARVNLQTGYVSQIKTGKLKEFRPSSDFEVKTAQSRFYVRYVGSSD